jgi:hypothetical protein
MNLFIESISNIFFFFKILYITFIVCSLIGGGRKSKRTHHITASFFFVVAHPCSLVQFLFNASDPVDQKPNSTST